MAKPPQNGKTDQKRLTSKTFFGPDLFFFNVINFELSIFLINYQSI